MSSSPGTSCWKSVPERPSGPFQVQHGRLRTRKCPVSLDTEPPHRLLFLGCCQQSRQAIGDMSLFCAVEGNTGSWKEGLCGSRRTCLALSGCGLSAQNSLSPAGTEGSSGRLGEGPQHSGSCLGQGYGLCVAGHPPFDGDLMGSGTGLEGHPSLLGQE